MKKNGFIILCFFCNVVLSAQSDSLRKFRISSIQVDVGTAIYPNYKQQNQADYQKVIENDAFLSSDLSKYEKQQWFVYNSVFNGLISLKSYLTINDKRKLNKEVFFGLKFGGEGTNGISYNKLSYDTIAEHVYGPTNRKLYEVYGTENEYSYAHTSQKLVVPLGINISTDRKNLFWITMGLELSPVFNFNYVFTSTNKVIHANITVTEGENLANYRSSYFLQDISIIQKKTKLSGLGYGLYASVPFTMYLNLFRRKEFLKRLSLLASISPLYVYSYNNYFGSASGITLSAVTGIRYNW